MKTARWISATALGASLLWAAPAAMAQTAPLENRVNRLEQEMRAVQRKVFPGGAGQILQPDVTAPSTAAPAAGSPASAPIDDLTVRVSAIESQLTRLTGQIEQTEFRLRQLESAFAAAQAKAAEVATVTAAAPAEAPVALAPTPPSPSVAPMAPPAAATAPAVRPAPPRQAPAAPAADNGRLQAVAAVERPSTGDAALDGYTYGFRLWSAKFYPEAQVQLRSVLEKHGNSSIASRAQNLLGRALLDDGNAAAAAKTLYENYRLRPDGDRAAESLAWVGEALIRLNQLSNACLAYDELDARFGTTMPSGVRTMLTAGRGRAKCGV